MQDMRATAAAARDSFVGSTGLNRFREAIDGLLVEQDLAAMVPATRFRAATAGLLLDGVSVLWADIPPLDSRREHIDTGEDRLFFLWVSEGSGHLRHRHGTEPLGNQSLVVIPGDEGFEVSYPERASVAFVAFTGPSVPLRYANLCDRVRSIPLGSGSLPVLPGTLSALRTGLDTVPALDPGDVEHLLDSAVSVSLGRAVDRGADTLAQLRIRACRLIDRRADAADLTPAGVADELFVSLRQLHRAFEGTDATVAAVIRRRRLDVAASLLGSSALGIAEIAHVVGFSGASHLSEWFRRSYGVSPSEYRELARIRQAPARI